MLLLLALLAQAPTDRPAGETRKHLQLLQAVPESQLFLAMNAMAQSLGVSCQYCHVREGATYQWERDDKPTKAVGRRMMKMVMDLNAGAFDGKQTVTCFTCHRGSLAARALPDRLPVDLTKIAAPPTLPDAAAIVARYRDAVGASSRVTSPGAIVLRGTDDRSDGRHFTFDVTLEGDRILVTRTSPQGTIAQSFDGVKGWFKTADGVRELTPDQVQQLRRAISVFRPIDMVGDAAAWKAIGLEQVGDRTAYVLATSTGPVAARTLFFDRDTGLLLRTVATTETAIVPLVDQVDYDDYRLVDGVRFPFLMRMSNVAYYDTSARKFTEIRTGVAVDDGVFNLSGRPK